MAKKRNYQEIKSRIKSDPSYKDYKPEKTHYEELKDRIHNGELYYGTDENYMDSYNKALEEYQSNLSAGNKQYNYKEKRKQLDAKTSMLAASARSKNATDQGKAAFNDYLKTYTNLMSEGSAYRNAYEKYLQSEQDKKDNASLSRMYKTALSDRLSQGLPVDDVLQGYNRATVDRDEAKEYMSNYEAQNPQYSEAALQNYLRMQQNKERTDAMSLDELRANAKKERDSGGFTEGTYNQMIQERYALGQSADDLIAERDKAAKDAQDRVLYYDDNDNAVTYDRLYREKVAENTWTNLTSDTEAYKLYEKIKEEEPTTMAMARSGAEAGNDMATLLADKQTLSQMGYNYDEIAYYEKYKADKEGYKESIKEAQNATPLKAAVFSIASAPLQSLEYADNAFYSMMSLGSDDSAYGLANIYDDKYRNKASVMLQGATKMINDYLLDATGSELVAWLGSGAYSGTVSSLQSMAQVAVCKLLFPVGGEAISLGLMASNAANQQFAESIKSGATNAEALAMSIGAGVNEALFEKLSIENLDALDEIINSQRWNYNSFEAFLKSIAQNSPSMLVQGLVEGSEEFFTDIANAIWDQHVNGSNAEYQRAIKEYMDMGYERSVASKMATQKFIADLASSFYGGFIGGLSSSGTHVIGGATGIGLHNTLGASMLGSEISKNNNVDVLLGQANELGDASVSERAAKVSQSENPSKRQIGRLAQEVYSKTADNIIQGHSKAFATEVESKLQDLDETERKQAVDVVSKYQRGEFLSSKERKLFAKVGGTDLIESITSDEEAMDRIRTSVEEDEEITKNQERLAETELLTRKDVKELRSFEGSKTKEAIDKAKEKAISIADEQEAKEETAKDFMRRMGYRQSTMNAVLAEVQRTGKDIGDISSFLLGVNEAINFGKIGYDQKYIKKNSYYGMLSQSQQNYAYQLGVDARAEGLAEEQARRDRRLGDLAKRTGKVHLMESADKAITELSKSTDKEDQERFASVIKARDVLSFITQNITHGNIYLFASEKNADGKYVVPEDLAEVFKGRENIIAGEIAKQNGIYDSATGDIYIDVNAGTGYEGVILMTAAHELTHFIRDWSPVKFRILGDFLIEQYQKANVPLNTLMQNRVAKGGSFDKEYEELVADSMERMLTDTNVYDKILALKAKDNDIFLKLKAGLEQIVESIKKAYRQFEGNQTMEGYFATTIDNLDKLQDLFAEALVDAGDVYSRATEMDDSEAFLDSKTAVLNQIRTPYTEGTNDWKNFVDGLNPEAKKVHDLFYNFYTLSKLNNVRNRKGNIVKKLNISSVFMTAQDWNEQIKKDSKWGDCAKKLAESLPPKIRERMHMNLDGSLNYDPLETEFKMAKSLAQRLVDALGYETIDNVYDLDGHKITLTTSGAVQSVGGEAYRRAVIAETRKLYKEGKLRQVNMDRMSKDLWGSLGFLAVNTKTGASGDFTTICPQMMFNRGCYYCYRRAALTTGVNNKLVAESVWYTGEILRIKQKDIEALNEDGGLRIQSFGDWMPHFSAQLADVIYDAELRGLQVKIITKEPSMIEYVAKLREQGLGKNLYFNLSADYAIEKAPERFTANTNKDSLDAINSSRPYMRNDDGMWWKRAMTVEEAYEYHKKYPWVNVRIVATTEDEFIRGLKDPRVYVVTGYHGNIREWERIDSTTGEKKLIVEPLGDAGMPWFIANEDGTWSIDPDRMGKNKNQKALGQRILNEGLVDLYYKKTCCIFGRCDQCKGKCGQAANTFYAKNALNDDQDSVAYWADNMTSERIRKNKKAGKEAWALYNESTDAESMLDWYHKTYGKPQAKFSFRGENAQNLTDADRKNLDQAKKMLEKGTSMEEIFRKTGWFTQSDGKWRNEISNKNDRLDVNGLNSVALERYDKRIKDANKAYEDGRIDKETYDDLVETAKKYLEEGSKSGKLDSFLDAPELFAAYPQLRKVSLFFEELPNKTIAQADLDKNSITIDLDRAFMNDEDVRETLLHEVQHFIQEYEGFSSGSNLRSGKYWTAGGEIEARDVEARTKMDEDQRRETMPAKFSTRDSSGKELTLEQQRYFKDSKIRDEEGNLVRVYHGTDANFTVFDRSKGRSTMDIQGSFFSPWEIDAEGYGVNVGAYYLNITNPAPEGIAYKALNRFKGQNDAGVKAREYLESLGYDGVNNSDEEYIAFYPNQIKNIDNLNPTTNEDIRYSERSASEHTMTAQEIIANISDLNSSDYKELFEQLLPDEEYDYYDVYDMGDAYKASMLVELLEGVDPDRTFRVWRGTSSENIKDIERFRFSERVKQGISSADTSLDQIPALFTDKRVKFGKTNVDIGGGKFDRATQYLAEQGTTNYIFDPFNRTSPENRRALDVVMNGGADTATCANVLNVIAEEEARANVIIEVAKAIKKDGTAYFMVYEGDGSGVGRETSKGYQNNRRTADYVDEISEYFKNVERHGKLIVATNPKDNLPKAAWQLDSSDNPEVVMYSNRDPEAVKQLEKVNAQLEKENAKLREDYAEIKELFNLQSKVTGGKLVKRSSVDALAKRLMKGLDLSGNRTEFTDLLMGAYSYIQGSEDVTWEEVSNRIQKAVDWAKNNQSEGVVVLTPEAKSLLKTIRESRVSLSDKMKADAASQYGSYNEFRKAMMGKITIANDAPQTLDQLWQELANDHPEYFDPNVSEADMPLLLADAIANIRNEGSEDYYLGQNMMTDQDIFNEIYDGFWDVATLYTVADKAQKEINQLKRKHADRMSDLKESHKEQVAQLKEEAKTRRKELQDRYREKLETQRQTLMSEYRERTNRARERRTATDLRHRITKKINELNKLLLKPDSKHHVPKDMQPYVADALNMLDLDNPRKGEKSRERLNALKKMYEQISKTSDSVLHYAYDQVIADMIDIVSEEIGDTPFQKMSVNQLEQVYQMYSAVLATIRNANKTFTYFKKQDIMELSEDVISEVKKVGGSKEMTVKWKDWLKGNLYWNNMKPIYAMRAIGSETLTKLFENVRRGEDTYARDITEAKNRFETLAKKYGYNDWDLDERFEFKTHDGRKFDLNVMEMMSLYEYYKRPQADAHLAQGGFVFEDNTVKKKNKLGITTEYKLNNANTHRVTPSMMAEIARKLTAEQKGFADEMQSYLAHEMGAKGNEISEALYDIDLYNEEHYFPLKSSKIYMASKQTETAGDAQIKNMGSSKALVPHANNPIILRGLMDVWVDHVNEMSMYHSFVLPLEDFQRVFNYTTPASGDDSPEGVKSAIRNAYGDAANNYIKTMLTDLNGGARADNRAGFMNKLIGTFKKGAVFASASVVIQQPSAIARAWAYIDPKYFAQTTLENLNLKNHSAQWEELKRYAPVAIIKEMGHFDTGLGANTEDWIKQTQPQGFMEKAKALIVDENYRDEILSKAPELADEIAWTHIWNAAKAQVLDQNPSLTAGSEEHLEEAGRLFTDTIVNTQVYDSVLSRSGMMRSKDTGVKMATSFMAEPTTSINMIIDAFTQAKRLGNGREARKIIGSVFAQIILNAALVSLVYAARDDDDDKTYAEKYIGQFASNTLESINPMTMIPYVKDIVSLLQGYDVERADMSVIADIIQSYRKLMSGEVDSKKVIDFANQIFKVMGVPTQNITRDVRSIYNIAQDIMSDNTTSIEGIRDSILEEVTGKSPSQQYKSRLTKAIKKGDTAKIKGATKEWIDQKVKTGKTEKEAKSAIQSSLTYYYKPLFLKAYQKNDQAEMARIRRALNATGIYKDIVETTQNWIKNSKE